MAAGDRGDEGLGAVTARHPEDVGAPLHRVLGDGQQVAPRAEHDGLDAPVAALLLQGEPFHLPAPDRGFMMSTAWRGGGAVGAADGSTDGS